MPTICICTELYNEDSVIIRIIDNGSGITEQVKPHIFEPMFTTKPVGKGAGLGLSICRQIVEEQHSDRLTYISSPDWGAEFAIEIPLQQPRISCRVE